MTNYPKGTTKAQWDAYELDLKNFNAYITRETESLNKILDYVNTYGVDNARRHFMNEINKSKSMDAPNKPGYYRANND